MHLSIKKQQSVKWIAVILSILLAWTLWLPSASYAVGEYPEMEDTTMYYFTHLGFPGQDSQPGWSLVGDPDELPKVIYQSYYGARIEASPANPSRSFTFEVPEDSRYLLRFSGYWSGNGGTADILVDGEKQGAYSFYSPMGNHGPIHNISVMDLEEGEHNLTLTLTDSGDGLGNGTGNALYPSQWMLIDLNKAANSKTRSTIYTPDKLANARANADKYDWAADLRNNAIAAAEKYMELDYDDLWNLVTGNRIPRSYNTNQLEGNFSPISGREMMDEYGYYPWQADPIQEPWKLTDPVSGYKFPTNDFGAYYESGLDEHGIFQPQLADRSLLVNELYPDKGPDWGVDDGFGWVDPETGERYTFIAYYNHWHVWHSGGILIDALNAFKNAFIYTGDMEYARKGAILLDRIADIYPTMDITQFDHNIYVNSHGGAPAGKAIGSIWETASVKNLIDAYDAFYPVYDDPEIIQYLQQKGEIYNLALKENAAQIRRNIEDGIIREVYPGMKTSRIRGNNGFHQSALAMAAVVLDTLPETKEWLDYNFQSGQFINQIPYRITGGNILYSMVNDVDRDGHGNEAAPGYNRLWLGTYLQVADALLGYDKYAAADLYENVKFRSMFAAMYPLTMLQQYFPGIGDSGSAGNPGLMLDKNQMIKAFDVFRDPIYAQLAYFLNGNQVEGIHGDVFSDDPDQIARDIEAVIETEGTLQLGSEHLAGYGFAGLRDGDIRESVSSVGLPFGEMTVTESTEETKYFANSGTIQFEADEAGQSITFSFEVPKTDVYEIELQPFHAASYGIYTIAVDGTELMTFDFYGNSGANSPEVVLTEMELTEGSHTISFVNAGKRDEASNYKFGVMSLNLYDEAAKEAKQYVGARDTQRALWMYYGRNTGHGHRDTLNLGLYAFGIDLSPDLGYPEAANSTNTHRAEWMNNTISHNTVVVDKAKQQAQWVAEPKHYDDSSMVKLIDVEAPKPYPQTDLYKRTSAMIRVDDLHSYVVDFFRVRGGDDHHFSFHGAEGQVTTEGLNLVPQSGGSYAGEDVPFGERPENDSVTGSGYTGPGFHWLGNVERDTNPSEQFSVDWDINDTWKVMAPDADPHLRLTMLGQYGNVALADGIPSRNRPGNPESLRYMIVHNEGENLETNFTAVLEPYDGERFVQSIEAAPVTTVDGTEVSAMEAKAVKITMKDGRTDVIINTLHSDRTYVIDSDIQFKGFFGVYSEQDGKTLFTYLNDGEYIGKIGGPETAAVPRITGSVLDFTKELSLDNALTVAMDLQGNELDALVGQFIYVDNDGERNGAYPIEQVETLSDGTYKLSVGEKTFIRTYQDPQNLEAGFIYNVTEGATFTIPLPKQEMSLSNIRLTAGKTALIKNEKITLQVSANYPDGSPLNVNVNDVKFKSQLPQVASVTGKGVVIGHNEGETEITATFDYQGITYQTSLSILVDASQKAK